MLNKKLTVIYSPMCRAAEGTRYFQRALELGYELEHISILELSQNPEKFPVEVQKSIAQLRDEGGFLAAPMVLLNGKLIVAWEVNDQILALEEGGVE